MHDDPFAPPRVWTPLPFAGIGSAEAIDSRRLHRGRAEAAILLADEPVLLSVAGPAEARSAMSGALSLPVSVGDAAGRIDLSPPLLRHLLDGLVPDRPARHPDIDLLLELALEAALKAMEAGFGRQLALRPPDSAVAAGLGHVVFRLSRRSVTLGHAGLRLAATEMALLIEMLDRLPAVASPLGRLPVPVIALAGRVTLPLRQLRSLRRGDVVLLDEAMPPGSVRLIAGEGDAGRRACTTAQSQTDGLVLSGAFVSTPPNRRRTEGTPMMDDSRLDDRPEPSGQTTLDDLTVGIVCEIGRCQVTLAELAAMRPGYVLDLGRSVTAGVDLMVGGRTVGKAELVQMDGTVGARVLRLFDHA